jgi:hypothetical protein
MESVLLPPFMVGETPEALTEEAQRELEAIRGLCQRLQGKGGTRLVFTSREALPAPFDAERKPAGAAPAGPGGRGEAGGAGLEPGGCRRGRRRSRRGPRGDRGSGGRGTRPRPHPGLAGPGAAQPGGGGHPRVPGGADGGHGAQVSRQP